MSSMSAVHRMTNYHACNGDMQYDKVLTAWHTAMLTLLQSGFTLVKLSAFASEMPPALQMAFSSSPSMLGYPGFLCMPCKHIWVTPQTAKFAAAEAAVIQLKASVVSVQYREA